METSRQRLTLPMITSTTVGLLALEPPAASERAFSYRARAGGPEQRVILKTLVALDGAGGDAARHDPAQARRAGTLFRLADRLVEEGVLAGSFRDMTVQHRLQKCAYIAQCLGGDIGYEFDFLPRGAFSTDLAVDIYHRWAAQGGSWPFAVLPREERGFFRLVRDRSTEWLEIATLALNDRETPRARKEFADHVVRENSNLDRRLAVKVFDEVSAVLASVAGEGSA